jgi:hypothetical protein
MKRMFVLPAVLLVISTSAVGAPNAASGYNVFNCDVKTINLEEGHSLTTFSGKGVQMSIPNSPDHMSSIECLGTIESMPDKSFKASGYCLHVDRDGDKWIDRWWNDSTMKKGRWEQTGVSGKYKGPRPTGTFVYTDLSSESACKGVSNWEVDR